MRTRNDPGSSAGIDSGWRRRQPSQAVPMVWGGPSHGGLLPRGQGQPKLQEQFVKPIKAMIEENP